MRYLTTGGAGFIGSNLVNRLIADGHDVTVFDNFSRGKESRLNEAARLCRGDIRSYDALADAAQGCDAILHLAMVQGTQTFYSEPREVLDVAIGGMLNVLKVCERKGIGELLLMSSSEAYQVADKVPTDETVPLSIPDVLNPRYSYGGGKAASEIMARAWHASGVLDRCIIARPHNIYGPDMGNEHVVPEFINRLKKLLPSPWDLQVPFPIQGTGMETRSFCYISDCVDALLLLLERAEPLGIYHVGTQDERTIAEVADAIAECMDCELILQPGTLPKGSPPRRCPDTAKIEALGYAPKVTFAEGIRETVAWYLAQ